MKTQFEAIEAVADKRHAKMCKTMSEKEAATNVAVWLEYLMNKFKINNNLVYKIKQLHEGYTAF